MFPKLENLGLRGVDLKSTPDWLLEFARKHHASKYTLEKQYSPYSLFYKEAVNKEDAAILSLLEVLIGRVFIPDPEDDYMFYNDCDTSSCFYYNLNESGDVIGLSIGCRDEDIWGYVLLSYFPEEICKLKHLEALRVCFLTKRYRLLLKEEEGDWNDQELDKTDFWIPKSIRELKSLRFLWTNADYPKLLKPFLDSLEDYGDCVFRG